jgi:hypothetical protein
MDVMNKSKLMVVLCAMALATGCAANKNNTHAKANYKTNKMQTASATTRPSSGSNMASAQSTTQPSVSAAINPLVGEWQLAVPRRRDQRSATIRATDSTHVTLDAGNKYLSGDYIVQGNFLLIITHDERLRSLAWKINSPDSLTVVRSPDFGNGRYPFTGVTLLRAPDDSATEADMSDVLP